jgi:hypothetical protein
MARWERDPQAQRQVLWFLALAEVMALLGNGFLVSMHYFRWIVSQMAPVRGAEFSPFILPMIATASAAVFLVYQGIAFAKGRAWARRLFLAENAVLIVLGLIWLAVRASDPAGARRVDIFGGLVLPMATLFPLLWPLWAFRVHPGPRPGTR